MVDDSTKLKSNLDCRHRATLLPLPELKLGARLQLLQSAGSEAAATQGFLQAPQRYGYCLVKNSNNNTRILNMIEYNLDIYPIVRKVSFSSRSAAHTYLFPASLLS